MKRDFYKTLQTIQATAGKKDLEKLFKFSQIKYIHFKKILGHQFHGKEIKDVQKEVQTFVAQQQNPEVKPEDILVLRSKATMGKFSFFSIFGLKNRENSGLGICESIGSTAQNPDVKPEYILVLRSKATIEF